MAKSNIQNVSVRKKSGEHLKAEMKLHNLTRENLSAYLGQFGFGYARDSSSDSGRRGYSRNHISRFCKGDSALPDDAARRLAEWWGVRFEYLKGLDDWRTDSDYYDAIRNAAPDDPLGAILSHLQFFKAVGLDVHPCIEIVPDVADLFMFWRLYELLLTAETLQMISESVPDFLQDVGDPSNMIFYDECDFPPLVLRTLPKDGKFLFDPNENKHFLSVGSWQAEITLSFDVRKGETVKRYSAAALDAFCEKLDALALCTIDNFLLSDG